MGTAPHLQQLVVMKKVRWRCLTLVGAVPSWIRERLVAGVRFIRFSVWGPLVLEQCVRMHCVSVKVVSASALPRLATVHVLYSELFSWA